MKFHFVQRMDEVIALALKGNLKNKKAPLSRK